LARDSSQDADLRFTPEIEAVWHHIEDAIRQPTRGDGGGAARGALVLIDGASGTGKTSLAEEMAARWPTGRDVVVVHMDDLYGGWNGLAAGILALEVSLLTPRAAHQDAHLRSYDWNTETWEQGAIIPANIDVIVEGCGSFGPTEANGADALIWLEAPEDLRRQRALGRGAEDFERHWDMWEQQFDQYQHRSVPAERASLTVQSNR
jgi:uridine kinase